MNFLLNVAKMDIQRDNLKFKLVQNLEKITALQAVSSAKSQMTVNSVPSQESIKNIYQGNLIERPLSQSSRNEVNNEIVL